MLDKTQENDMRSLIHLLNWIEEEVRILNLNNAAHFIGVASLSIQEALGNDNHSAPKLEEIPQEISSDMEYPCIEQYK